MDFRVLGPVEVLEGDSRLNIGGRKQRTVLSVLIANVGQPTSTDRLIQATYGDDASAGARHSVQTFISNLRGQLGDVVVSRGHAYELETNGSTFDHVEFADLIESARERLEMDPAGCQDQLRRALAMWRGHPFQDVDGGGELDLMISHLNELRMSALEARIEADLAIGNHRSLVGELRALTVEYPFRETFHGQYMLALYRSGRQADALRAYQQMRTLLADELGIDPSPRVQQLEQRILEQDPALIRPQADSPIPSPPVPSDQRSGRTSGSAIEELDLGENLERVAPVVPLRPVSQTDAAPTARSTAVAVESATSGGSSPPLKGAVLAAVALVLLFIVGVAVLFDPFAASDPVDVLSGAIAESEPIAPIQVAPADPESPALTETDPSPDTDAPLSLLPPPEIVRTVTVGAGPKAAFADDSGVWFTLTRGAAIVRVDPADLDNVTTIEVGQNPTIPLVMDNLLWVPARRGGALTVVDKYSFEVVKTIIVGERLDTPVLAADGRVWVTAREDEKLVVIDPSTYKTVRSFDLPGWPLTPVFSQGALWVVGRDNGAVTRVDPFALTISEHEHEHELEVGSGPFAPIVVNGDLWISDRRDGTITVIDTLARSIDDVIDVGGSLSAPILVDGQVWVADTEARTVLVYDAASRKLIKEIDTGYQTTFPAAHEGTFWAVDSAARMVIRIDPELLIVSHEFPLDGRPVLPMSSGERLWIPDDAGNTVTVIE